jgi:very-short-patch-repair endonuclease
VDNVGRRRYVDVEMRTRRGRKLVVEIDGAVHLIVGNYWSDMARANELVIAGQSILRFPTVALYLDEALVADQLRRAVND